MRAAALSIRPAGAHPGQDNPGIAIRLRQGLLGLPKPGRLLSARMTVIRAVEDFSGCPARKPGTNVSFVLFRQPLVHPSFALQPFVLQPKRLRGRKNAWIRRSRAERRQSAGLEAWHSWVGLDSCFRGRSPLRVRLRLPAPVAPRYYLSLRSGEAWGRSWNCVSVRASLNFDLLP